MIADVLIGEAKLPVALTIQPKPLSNKYHVPFSIRGLPVTKKFIDRPAEMQPLQETLLSKSDRRKTFVLRGLGGIGKTQLAIEFIRMHQSKFSAVFWLDGNTEDSLKRTLARYAGKIPPEQMSDTSKIFIRSGEGDVDTVVQEVLEWLAVADNSEWLLVFDNVDQENEYDIEQYLPDADHGSILITTRLARMEQLGDSQEIGKVSNDTALAILKSRYKGSYGEDADFIKLS